MFVSVNGAKLYFDVDGEGVTPDGSVMREKPTVVMVHGGPGADHTVSKPFFSQLTDIAQVVYYDHRGNGRSDLCDEDTWTLEQWADDLKGLCDALGIEKPIVIGTSFGGFVTLAYATKYPDHASGLALISTSAKVEFPAVYDAFHRVGGEEISKIAEAYWENPTDEGRALYRDRCVPFYDFAEDNSSDWLVRILWRNETALWFNGPNNEHGRFDFRDRLSKINCPTLVMVGEEDPITPPEFSDALVAGLRADQTHYIRFDRCGHGVVGDKPDEALKALRQFIRSVSTSSR
ncbi:alpha/beta hydrolase [Shimia sp.]|uniref:alpha/beta fold hydrolase n=1 Tax=Shimia sp. TaxID=1954381 RepID=UPI00329740DB